MIIPWDRVRKLGLMVFISMSTPLTLAMVSGVFLGLMSLQAEVTQKRPFF